MSLHHSPRIITDGLILFLDAANSKSYPGSGTSIFNLVGNNTHVLSGGAAYTVLNGVQCFDCSVSGYYIAPTSANQTLPTSGYTYVAWARMKSSNAEWRTLWRTTPDDHPILVQSGGTELGMFENNGTGFNSSGYNTTPIYETWCQWTVVGSVASGSAFYINNGQVGSTVAKSAGGNNHNMIGAAGGSQAFGHVATAMLYNRILSVSEITQNFQTLRGRYGV